MLPSPGQGSSPSTHEKMTEKSRLSSTPKNWIALPHTMQLISVAAESALHCTPAPVFPVIVQLVMAREESFLQYTPVPPFPVIVHSVRVGEESSLQQTTPPPDPTEFPEMVQLVSVGEKNAQKMPPPKNFAELSEIR